MYRVNLLLFLVCITVIIGVFSQPPISQPESYHQFADQKTFFGVPNTMNVLSNIPFVLGKKWFNFEYLILNTM